MGLTGHTLFDNQGVSFGVSRLYIQSGVALMSSLEAFDDTMNKPMVLIGC